MITDQLNECFQTNTVPEWMTTGKTSLIVKDREMGSEATNFRPITCLPKVWKLFTSIIAEEHLAAPREEEIVTR